MRVITGSAKGKRLQTSEGNDVRPTPERVKEAIFSSIQFEIEGRTFLDLFAGSGQMGIEALSRGAKFCTFVDSNAQSIANITANVKNTGFEGCSKIIRGDFRAVVSGLSEPFDFVFLDPPYADEKLLPAAELVQRIVSENGTIICEHPKEQTLPDCLGEFRRVKLYKHGHVHFSVYKREVAHVE